MTNAEREALLSLWIQPSSSDEQTQQDRAERMITDAVKAHEPLRSAGLRVYAKGSYPNNTNVRRDSDVDIAVQCTVCEYYDHMPGQQPENPLGSAYEGDWTPGNLRREVRAALINAFGSSSVTAGSIALTISEVKGSRPSTDVVPSFNYALYNDPYRRSRREGSCVFRSDDGAKIVNWPMQQLVNGRAKNLNTGGRYKRFVRALKNAENVLARNGTIDELPSYFMECLTWNVENTTLQSGSSLSLDSRQPRRALDGCRQRQHQRVGEPNDIKYLFREHQSWTVEQRNRSFWVRGPTLTTDEQAIDARPAFGYRRKPRLRGGPVRHGGSSAERCQGSSRLPSDSRHPAHRCLGSLALASPGVQRLSRRPFLNGIWSASLRPTPDSHIPQGGNRGPIVATL